VIVVVGVLLALLGAVGAGLGAHADLFEPRRTRRPGAAHDPGRRDADVGTVEVRADASRQIRLAFLQTRVRARRAMGGAVGGGFDHGDQVIDVRSSP
jgi:hypothetical protein